jgi:glycerophosphoryl diester phosphodiesterase
MKIIGHRGARGLAPENTLASFAKALEHGVDEIELDVRVTKDHIAIVHHDKDLHDPSGNAMSIVTSTYNELKAHKPDLNTFEEAMRAINRAVPVLVEVKPHVTVAPISKVINTLLTSGWSNSDMLLASFSQHTLLELHAAQPGIEKVVIERWSSVKAVYRAKQVSAVRLNMRASWLWYGVIRGLSHRGYKLAPYTVNDVAKIKRWEKYGLSAVITDYPDRFSGW